MPLRLIKYCGEPDFETNDDLGLFSCRILAIVTIIQYFIIIFTFICQETETGPGRD